MKSAFEAVSAGLELTRKIASELLAAVEVIPIKKPYPALRAYEFKRSKRKGKL